MILALSLFHFLLTFDFFSDSSFIAALFLVVLLQLILIKKLSEVIQSLKNKKDLWHKLPILILFLLLSGGLKANTLDTEEIIFVPSFFITVLLGLIAILFLIILYLKYTLNQLVDVFEGKEVESKKIMLRLTDAVPVAEEKSILLNHDYDGIEELNNNLPPWWKSLFYATIIFAGIYFIRFLIFTPEGGTMLAEYKEELLIAEEQKAAYLAQVGNLLDETNVTLLTDEKALELGAAIYASKCTPCHGALGEGGIGPNLTDAYWIHGGAIGDVFSTIKYGIPEKGMISWKSELGAAQMQQLASYILVKLKGSNPPNAKAPQGELYEEGELHVHNH